MAASYEVAFFYGFVISPSNFLWIFHNYFQNLRIPTFLEFLKMCGLNAISFYTLN
jgi:hypothetical protein